ncbi:hypothetical protein L7F22_016206 [Adiantum nelumboides]|nr:hypothetical protein [Adiantum nelumboides]
MDVALDRLLIPGPICPPRRPVLCAAYNSSSTPQSVQFRPCIDIHKGKVKQIVGSTLSDQPGSAENLVTNFESEKSAAEYAQLYQRDGLFGGHVIILGSDEASQHSALEAVNAFPGSFLQDNFLDNSLQDSSVFGHAFQDKRPLLKQDALPMDFGIEDDLDKIDAEMTAVIFNEMLLLDSTLLRRQHLPPLSHVDKDYAPFVMVTIGDKGKQAVRVVRVSKVVSVLMLNANTNVSIPVNLSNQVLSLLGSVGKHPLNVLVDSGCSTNFVSTMLVSKLRLPTQQSVEAFQVELADGLYLQCNKKVQQLEFQIQDYQDQLGFSVMPLSHYDMILGQSWLCQYDPIISFRDHSIRLFHRNQEVELRGLFNTANYNGICYASEAFGTQKRLYYCFGYAL